MDYPENETISNRPINHQNWEYPSMLNNQENICYPLMPYTQNNIAYSVPNQFTNNNIKNDNIPLANYGPNNYYPEGFFNNKKSNNNSKLQYPLPPYDNTCQNPFSNNQNDSNYPVNTNISNKTKDGLNPEKDTIIHFIQPNDNLLSLSLQYGVTTRAIKMENKLETDDIYWLNEIKIPNPKQGLKIKEENPFENSDNEEAKKENMVIAFRRRLTDIGIDPKCAISMLEENEWNYQKAIKFLDQKHNLKRDIQR